MKIAGSTLFTLLVLVLFQIGGCGGDSTIKSAISDFESKTPEVKLGDSKENVLAILEPTQAKLSSDQKKRSETYLLDKGTGQKGVVEIYFYRSRLLSDDLTTDDEFTPYIFTDGVLTGIGWVLLGGPGTQGQVRARGGGGTHRSDLQCFQNGPFMNCR